MGEKPKKKKSRKSEKDNADQKDEANKQKKPKKKQKAGGKKVNSKAIGEADSAGMTEEEARKKVQSASTYLGQTLSDVTY